MLPPFPGFRKQAMDFLRGLRENNDREWFKSRKDVFDDELVWPMQCLVAELSLEASRQKLPFTGDPSTSLFRIYRDTRFSKNKLPYKNHLGAALTSTGSRKEKGGLYIHIEPEAPFVCAGYWRPETPVLTAWRRQMVAQPDAFMSMVEEIERKGYTLGTDESLKRIPAGLGIDQDDPVAEYVRWKDLYVMLRVDENRIAEPAFAGEIVQLMVDSMPLMEFGRRAGALGKES
jgi:uncharacterized protein (TIGR02453 family)